MYGASLAIE
jgi:hypothetical protein